MQSSTMSKYFSLFLLCASQTVFAQKEQLPIIRSTTSELSIIENKEIITKWYLNPNVEWDVYQTGKNPTSKNIKIVTDIDSLAIDLKAGQTFDFLVVQNDKDTFKTRFTSPKLINYATTKPKQKSIIPFQLTDDNNIQTQATLNHKDSVKLLFDSGATGFYLKKTVIKSIFNPEGKPLTMKDISDNHFQIADLKWDHEQIYPLETTGDCCVGMYGWDAFDGKVMEINYDKNEITVYTKKPKISADYAVFDMEIMKEHFCIYLEIEIDNKRYKVRFLFDTGFQKGLMLDKTMMTELGVAVNDLPVLKKSVMYNSQNQEIPVTIFTANKLIVGKYVLENIPAQLNESNRPAGYATNFLGNEVLKRFNAILVFQNNKVYLKPNHLLNVAYLDKK